MTTTTATPKAVNYTADQTVKMVADYLAGVTTEAIALELGKTVKSVVAKLSREKVYVAKTYKTKTGEAVAKKDDLADKIGAMVSGTESEIESLTKVNKTMLKKLLDALDAFDAQKESHTVSEFDYRDELSKQE